MSAPSPYERPAAETAETEIYSLEKKWIAEQISFETYNRWHNDLAKQRNLLRSQIGALTSTKNDAHSLLLDIVQSLTNVRAIYEQSNTPLKQELIRTVFDNSLYYENKVYGTPYLIPELSHNELIMREKNLLYIKKRRKSFNFLVRWS